MKRVKVNVLKKPSYLIFKKLALSMFCNSSFYLVLMSLLWAFIHILCIIDVLVRDIDMVMVRFPSKCWSGSSSRSCRPSRARWWNFRWTFSSSTVSSPWASTTTTLSIYRAPLCAITRISILLIKSHCLWSNSKKKVEKQIYFNWHLLNVDLKFIFFPKLILQLAYLEF